MTRRTPWKIALVAATALVALGGAWERSRGPAVPAAAAAATDTVTLAANQCTNVGLTWPQGTSVATVAAAVSPAGALESIWKQTIRDDRLVFVAWSPIAGAPNDYTNTELPLEAAFICMRAAGTLERPNR